MSKFIRNYLVTSKHKSPKAGLLCCGKIVSMNSNITQSQLSNGLPVIMVNLPSHTTITILVLTRAGLYFEDSKTNGLSHFLEHVCFKGTKTWEGKALMRHLDGLGAETNAFTSEEFTGYYAKGSPEYYKQYLAAVSDIFINPTFPTDEVIKERGVVAGEYDMYQDQPTYQAQKLLQQVMFGAQPAGWEILGTKKNITSFTQKEVLNLHNKHYTVGNSVLVVAGPVANADILFEAHNAFADAKKGLAIKRTKVISTQNEISIKAKKAETDQSHICIGFRGISRTHKDKTIANMISSVLSAGMSSRLFVKLREEMGAGYYVGATHAAYSDHGYLELRCGTTKERVSEVVTALLNECYRITTELVTVDELQKVKNYLRSHSNMGLESSDAWAEFAGIQYLVDGKIESLNEKLALIDAVTPKDVMRVAKSWLTKNNATVVVYGNTTQLELSKGIKNSNF